MNSSSGIVREISWRDVFPWLVLFRTVRVALQPSVLFLAFLGALIAPLGWRVAEAVLLREDSTRNAALQRVILQQRSWPGREHAVGVHESDALPRSRQFLQQPLETGFGVVFRQLTSPFRLLLSGESFSITEYLYLATGGLWSLLVWGFVGGAIVRLAVVKFSIDEDTGMVRAAGLAFSRWRSLVIAPLVPVLTIYLLALPGLILGWLMRFDGGVFLGGIVWVVICLAGFVMALMLVGITLGWPLMPAAIMAEQGGDQYEAFHRSYSYVYGRPLHYGFYIAVALGVGLLGCLVVDLFADQTLKLAGWSVSWGAGDLRWHAIRGAMAEGTAGVNGDTGGFLAAGARLIHVVERLVILVAFAFRYAFFFVASSAIYLLMRQQVDDAEFDEIYRDDEEILDEQKAIPLVGDATPPATDSDL